MIKKIFCGVGKAVLAYKTYFDYKGSSLIFLSSGGQDY